MSQQSELGLQGRFSNCLVSLLQKRGTFTYKRCGCNKLLLWLLLRTQQWPDDGTPTNSFSHKPPLHDKIILLNTLEKHRCKQQRPTTGYLEVKTPLSFCSSFHSQIIDHGLFFIVHDIILKVRIMNINTVNKKIFAFGNYDRISPKFYHQTFTINPSCNPTLLFSILFFRLFNPTVASSNGKVL